MLTIQIEVTLLTRSIMKHEFIVTAQNNQKYPL